MGCTSSTDTAPEGDQNDDQFEIDFEYEQTREAKDNKPEDDAALCFEAEEENEEKFMATKPWIGALVAPTDAPEVVPDAPELNLELEYVNGYRCEDSRQNVYWSQEAGKIVYMTAALGVVLDVGSNTQKFMGAGKAKEVQGHNDDITALHICPERKLVVTGQRGKNPLIIVWDAVTMEILAQTKQGRGTRAVRTARFSKDGKFVFTCDEHNDHNIHVFETEGLKKVAQDKTGGDPIADMDTSAGAFSCGIAAKRGCMFYTLSGNSLNQKRGLFGSYKRQDMMSIAFFGDGNKCAAGAIGGDIYIYAGNSVSQIFSAHRGAIHAISVIDNKIYSSGSKDYTLKVHNAATQELETEIKMNHYAKSIDSKDGKILIGTRDGQLLVHEQETTVLMNGHSSGETWGLHVDPNTGLVSTTGDDNKILSFDPKTNKTVASGIVNEKRGRRKRILGASTLSFYPPNQNARAIAVNASNGHVAIGTNDGELQIRESNTNIDNIVYKTNISKQWIEVMQYSPDGSKLAVGSHDNRIYILDVANNYSQTAVCSKHNSFITSLDWSTDGNAIQSVCGAYEYLFYDANSGAQQTSGASQHRDEEWASFTCKLGWPVRGVFPPYTDGSHVNGVDRSKSKLVFASGDDWGLVNLYRNPNAKGSKANSFRAHSSHVVRVRFNNDDSYLYSVGGYDRTLMKWKVV